MNVSEKSMGFGLRQPERLLVIKDFCKTKTPKTLQNQGFQGFLKVAEGRFELFLKPENPHKT